MAVTPRAEKAMVLVVPPLAMNSTPGQEASQSARGAWDAGQAADCDLAIVGAGAAGLMAGIWAGRTGRCRRIVALDGARTLGAKILVAGGGRCNVTHDVVDESAFAGSSRNAIRKVLLRFDAARTAAFFDELGVPLRREETGKLFPVSNRAQTVLDALLGAARAAGARTLHPWRVESIARAAGGESGAAAVGGRAPVAGDGEGFLLSGRYRGEPAALRARRVILAAGGMSLPKSGSDGSGFALAKSLGHAITPRVFPALVPLLLDARSFARGLPGVATPVTVEVRTGEGRRAISLSGPILCTHFGVSGPVVLDASRYLIDARADDGGARLVVSWLPGETVEGLDAALRDLGTERVARWLGARLPARLAQALLAAAGVDAAARGSDLTRATRRALATTLGATELPVTGDRGFTHAEATAGGVPLSELRLETMASRVCPGLHVCGEVCDVDGRVGGYNFQWAWSSGYVAGISADPETA